MGHALGPRMGLCRDILPQKMPDKLWIYRPVFSKKSSFLLFCCHVSLFLPGLLTTHGQVDSNSSVIGPYRSGLWEEEMKYHTRLPSASDLRLKSIGLHKRLKLLHVPARWYLNAEIHRLAEAGIL